MRVRVVSPPLPYLSPAERGHGRVLGGEPADAGLPPPAAPPGGEPALGAQCRAEAVHPHMLIQQTAGRQTDRERDEGERERHRLNERDRKREMGERKRYTEIEIGERETEREGERDT